MDRHTRHGTGGSFPPSLHRGIGWTVRSQARLAHSRRAAGGLEKACGGNMDYGLLGLAYGDRGHVDRLPLVSCLAPCGPLEWQEHIRSARVAHCVGWAAPLVEKPEREFSLCLRRYTGAGGCGLRADLPAGLFGVLLRVDSPAPISRSRRGVGHVRGVL